MKSCQFMNIDNIQVLWENINKKFMKPEHFENNSFENLNTNNKTIIGSINELSNDNIIIKGSEDKSIIIKNTDNVNLSDLTLSIGNNNNVGLKGYYFKAIDFSRNIIYLSYNSQDVVSVDVSPNEYNNIENIYCSYSVDQFIYITHGKNYNIPIKIILINPGYIQVDNIPFNIDDVSIKGEHCIYDLNKPDLGQNNLGQYAIAFGSNNKSINKYSFSEGYNNIASGLYSHVSGSNNRAFNSNEFSIGRFNKSNTDTIFSIGIGDSDENRINALEVKQNGELYIKDIDVNIQSKLSEIDNIKQNLGSMSSTNIDEYYTKPETDTLITSNIEEITSKLGTMSSKNIEDYYDKTTTKVYLDELKESIKNINAGIQSFNFKGSQNTYDDLQNIYGQVAGDVWHIKDTNGEYLWDGLEWLELGTITNLDLEDKINEAKSYAKSYTDGKDTAMSNRVDTLEAIDHDAYKAADETVLTEAKSYTDEKNTAMNDRVAILEAINHDAYKAADETVLTEAKSYTDEKNTAMNDRVAILEAIDHDAYKAADETVLTEANTYTDQKIIELTNICDTLKGLLNTPKSKISWDPGRVGGINLNVTEYYWNELTFDGEIEYYEEDSSLNRASGNRVGVVIVPGEGLLEKYPNVEVNISGYDNTFTKEVFNEYKDFGYEPMPALYFYPLVEKTPQEYIITITWDENFKEIFKVKISKTSKLKTL